jgi:hypothetical protein
MVRRLVPCLAVVGGAAAAVALWASAAHAATAPPVPEVAPAGATAPAAAAPAAPATVVARLVGSVPALGGRGPLPHVPPVPASATPAQPAIDRVTKVVPGAMPSASDLLHIANHAFPTGAVAPALGANANAGYAPAPGAVADSRSPRGSGHDETRQAPAPNALSVDRSDSAPAPVVALPCVPVGSVDGTTQPGGLSFAALLVAFALVLVPISRRTLVRRVVTLGRAFELHPARPG